MRIIRIAKQNYVSLFSNPYNTHTLLGNFMPDYLAIPNFKYIFASK